MSEHILRTVNWVPGLSVAPEHFEELERLTLDRAAIDSAYRYPGAGLLPLAGSTSLTVVPDPELKRDEKVVVVAVKRLLAVDARGVLMEIGGGNEVVLTVDAATLSPGRRYWIAVGRHPSERYVTSREGWDDRAMRMLREEARARLPRYVARSLDEHGKLEPDDFVVACLEYSPREGAWQLDPDFLPHAHAFKIAPILEDARSTLKGAIEACSRAIWAALPEGDHATVVMASIGLSALDALMVRLEADRIGPEGVARHLEVLVEQCGRASSVLGTRPVSATREKNPGDAQPAVQYSLKVLTWLGEAIHHIGRAEPPAAQEAYTPEPYDYRTDEALAREASFQDEQGQSHRVEHTFQCRAMGRAIFEATFHVNSSNKLVVFVFSEGIPTQDAFGLDLSFYSSDGKRIAGQNIVLRPALHYQRNVMTHLMLPAAVPGAAGRVTVGPLPHKLDLVAIMVCPRIVSL